MSLNDSFGLENGLKVETVKEADTKDKKEKTNCIFSSIPMEIEKEEGQVKEYYNYLYLKEKIFFNLNNLFNYINQKLNNKKNKFFIALKQKSNNKFSKLVNAQILYMLIETNFKLIEHLWNKKE